MRINSRHDCPSDGRDYHGRCLGTCSECGEHMLADGRYTPYCPSCDTCAECGGELETHAPGCAVLREAENELRSEGHIESYTPARRLRMPGVLPVLALLALSAPAWGATDGSPAGGGAGTHRPRAQKAPYTAHTIDGKAVQARTLASGALSICRPPVLSVTLRIVGSREGGKPERTAVLPAVTGKTTATRCTVKVDGTAKD